MLAPLMPPTLSAIVHFYLAVFALSEYFRYVPESLPARNQSDARKSRPVYYAQKLVSNL